MDKSTLKQIRLLAEAGDLASFADTQPQHLRPLFVACGKIEKGELLKTLEAGDKLVSALDSGNTNDARLLEDSFTQLHKTYKSLPAAATDVILSQAPRQARTVLTVAKELDTESVKAIAKDIPAIVSTLSLSLNFDHDWQKN